MLELLLQLHELQIDVYEVQENLPAKSTLAVQHERKALDS